MKKETGKEALFRKFINNQCSRDEIAQVFEYLRSSGSDKTVYMLIAQELQESALSNKKIDVKISEEMRLKILEQIQEFSASQSAHLSASRPAAPLSAAVTSGSRPFYWKMAAVFTGIFLLAGAAAYRLFIYSPMITRSTSYGEIATVILPDSSRVILNGNSGIRYTSEWDNEGPREVWIEGEAFFSVRHTENNRKFLVKTTHGYDVEVLGTEFSVYDRDKASRVVLNKGKVQLNIRKGGKTNRLAMQPGELVEFKDGVDSILRRTVNPEQYSSWINKEILLENTSFREIVAILEETYGLSVAVNDTSLYNERFTGTVPSENASVLLKALSISFGLDMEINDKKIFFKPKTIAL